MTLSNDWSFGPGLVVVATLLPVAAPQREGADEHADGDPANGDEAQEHVGVVPPD